MQKKFFRYARKRTLLYVSFLALVLGAGSSLVSRIESTQKGSYNKIEEVKAASGIIEPKAKWTFSNTTASNIGYDSATEDGTNKYFLDNSGSISSDGTWATSHGNDLLYPTTLAKDPFVVYKDSDKTFCWNMKVSATNSAWTVPINFTFGSYDNHLNLVFSANSSLLRIANTTDGTDHWWGSEIVNMTLNQEYQFTMVISQGTSTKIYVNGSTTPAYSGGSVPSSAFASGWSSFSVGGKVAWNDEGGVHTPTGIEFCANGVSVKNMRFYNRAFTSTQVKEYYDEGEISNHNLQAAYVFTDNAILQRGKPCNIYGFGGTVGKNITVEFNGQTKSCAPESDGSWCVTLDSMNANATGQQLKISDAYTSLTFKNVRVGEVWYASGQSNQAYSFGDLLRDRIGATGYPTYTADQVYSLPVATLQQIPEMVPYLNYTNYGQIGILAQNYHSSATVDTQGIPNTYGWGIGSSLTNFLGHSAYSIGFALRLQEKLGVPVGIINSSVGGSSVEEWISEAKFTSKGLVAHYAGKGKNPYYLYNGMTASLNKYTVNGLLWYQGEADAGQGDYSTTQTWVNDWGNEMVAMVEEFRSNHGSVPVICQMIAQYDDWAELRYIREKAWNLQNQISNYYCVNGIGYGLPFQTFPTNTHDNFIHPIDKYGNSRDAANIALCKAYSVSNVNGLAPRPVKGYYQNGNAIIEFAEGVNLYLKSGTTVNLLSGCINGAWGNTITNATVSGNKIIIPGGSKYSYVAYAQYNLMMPGAKSAPSDAKWLGRTLTTSYNSDSSINLYAKGIDTDLAVVPWQGIQFRPDDSLVVNSTLKSRIALISDTHYRGTGTWGDKYVEGAFKDIDQQNYKFDAIINLGDLSESGYDRSHEGNYTLDAWYNFVANNQVKNPDSSVVPVYGILGNHDCRGDSTVEHTTAERQEDFLKAAKKYQDSEIYSNWGANKTYDASVGRVGSYGTSQVFPDLNYVATIGGYKYVFMNSSECQWDQCMLTEEAFAWLDNTLTTLEASEGDKPIFLCFHQSLDCENNSIKVVGKSDFAFHEMLSKHRTTIHLSGHTHNAFGILHNWQNIEIGGYNIANAINVPSLEHNGGSDYAAWGIPGYTVKDKPSTYSNIQYFVVEIYENGVVFKAREVSTNPKAGTYDITNAYFVESSYVVTNNIGTVKFISDGSEISSKQYKYGETIDVPANPTKAGYSFQGWDSTVSPTCKGSITYTAVFKADTKEVTIGATSYCKSSYLSTDANATSGSASGTKFDYGSTVYEFVTLNDDTEQYKYSAPSGWTNITGNTYRVASKTIGLSGNSFADVSAVRTLQQYEVTFGSLTHVHDVYLSTNTSATSGSPSGTKFDYGTTVYIFMTLDDDTAEHSYSAPSGWTLVSGKTRTYYKSLVVGASGNNFGDITATSTVNTYTVNFDANGHGTAPEAYTNITYGSKINKPTDPSEPAYIFNGWFKEKSCTNPWDFGSDTVIGTTTLYAKWSEDPAYPASYTVEHYQQNIDNDEYTKVTADTEVIQGIYKADTEAVAKSYTGFTAQPFAQEKIALDGSTVVKIYYNRNIHSVSWDANGGELSGTYSTGNFKYGATLVAPTATKTGHTFSSWTPSFTGVMGDADVEYKATYNVLTFTVQWEVNGEVVKTENNVSYGTTPSYDGATPTKPSTAEFDYTFSGWNPTPAAIIGDTTYVAQFNATTRSYVVSFEMNGHGSSVDSQNVLFNQKATRPINDPSETGYTFKNWYKDIELTNVYDFDNEVITGVTTIYAKWEINTYAIKYDSNGGSGTMSDKVKTYNVDYVIDSFGFTAPTGSHFVSWNTQNDGKGTSYEPDDIYVINESVTFYAIYELDTYTISFNSNGGTGTMNDASKAYGLAYILPNNGFTPATDMVFANWNTSADGKGVTYNPGDEYITNESITFYAIWEDAPITEANYTVKHHQQNIINDEYTEFESEVLSGTIGEDTAAVAKNYTGFTSQSFTQKEITSDGLTIIDIYYTRNRYTLSWDAGEGGSLSGEYTSGEVKYGTTIIAPNASKDGYTFDKWDSLPPETMPAEAKSYTAQYIINKYTVTWEVNGEVVLTQNDVNYGTTPSYSGQIPTKPSSAEYDYEFIGWAPSIAPITGDTNYVAQFNAIRHVYIVNFVMADHGTQVPSQNVEYGNKVTKPTDPSEFGWNFVGWYKEGLTEVFNFNNEIITKNTSIYAKWEEVPLPQIANYTVKHYQQNILDNQYTLVSADTQVLTGTIGTLTEASANTYVGFVAKPFSQVQINADGDSVVSIYYDRNVYVVTFDVQGHGTAPSSVNVKHGGKVSKPNNPSADGYTFVGWYYETSCSNEVNFDNAITTNVTFYAKWNALPKQYSIATSYSSNGAISTDKVIANEGEQVTITITPNNNAKLKSITVNGVDYTNKVKDNKLVLIVNSNIEVYATFEIKGGCASSIYGTSIIVTVLAVGAIILLIRKKKQLVK